MRMMPAVISLTCLVMALTLSPAAELPNPWAPCEQPCLGPAPVPVMEQMFWVQLPIKPDIDIAVVAPEGVTLLDQTKPGQRDFTRLYFRADRGLKDAQIVLTPAGGDRITVPLTVRTYREDLDEQLKRVPEIVPSARKQGRSYYTDELIAIARDNMQKHPQLVDDLKKKAAFDSLTDDELWNWFPAWSIPRQCNGDWPCPHCGEAIYAKSTYYPWQWQSASTWKCQCPLCGKLFPTNDYTKDDFTSGEFPDDGWGCDLAGNGERKDAAAWIAYHNHHLMWRVGRGLKQMALRHLLTGDEAAAHKVGLLLARLAYVYPGLDLPWQQVRPRLLGRPGRALTDGAWERNELLEPALQAYDAIFDYLDTDLKLVEFLHARDPSINSPDDVKALLDTCLVQVFGWDWMARRLGGGSQGAREQNLAQMIVCADMDSVCDRWLEEMFTHSYNSGMNRGGFDDENFTNTLTREGTTLVNGIGYQRVYFRHKSDLAEIMSRIQSPKWQARCNLYDPLLYPKFRAEFDTWIDMLGASQFEPCYGDTGAAKTYRFPNGLPATAQIEYARAYSRFPTDRIARAIYKGGKPPPQLFEPDVWADVEAHVKRVGPAPPLESRVMDGMGLVFLESRAHATDINDRAALALRYGYALDHHHHDNLNIEMWAHGDGLSPEVGYPSSPSPQPLGNTQAVAHHNTGMIDRKSQYPNGPGKGALELFAGAPEASFCDVSAEPAGFPNRMYRRALCLADAPGGNAYLFDVLRMAGGTIRTYCFHGPPEKSFETNLDFGPKSDKPWEMHHTGRGGPCINILEPQEATADGDVWGHWACQETDMQVRLDILGRPGRHYFTAFYGKPDVFPLKYLFAEEVEEDEASEFITLWQPYLGEPFIEKFERLSVTGDVLGEFSPVALRVTLQGGQVDTFIYTHDPEAKLRIGDIEFRGSFGYWSEQAGKPRCLHLVNGSRLTRGGVGVVNAEPSLRAKTVAVDLVQNTITLDTNLPVGDTLKGKLIYSRYGPHRTAYHVEAVLKPGNVVKLDLNSIIFRSKVLGFSEDKSHLIAEIMPTIPASGGANPHGYYDGAMLTGEDHKAHYRVTGIEGTGGQDAKMYLDRPAVAVDFPDIDGDGRRMLQIYDIGPGDEVTVYNSVFADFASARVIKGGRAELAGI